MSNPVFAWIVTGVGVLFVLISAFADPLGLGRSPGLGWRQTLGVIIGALLIAAGLFLRRRPKAAPRSRAPADTPGHPTSAISAVHETSESATPTHCRDLRMA